MKKKILYYALMVSIFAGATAARAMTLNGAGASFPFPVYRVWTYNYKQDKGTTVNYQSVGSGAGIKYIKSRTVDFGASDKPLKKAELDKSGLLQFPMLMGGVVLVVNIPGVDDCKLKLTTQQLSDIYMGKIKKWDDPAIKKVNPGLKLPAIPIMVVHRTEGSGTTWIFTNYLAKVSKEWANGPGCGKTVDWPVGIGGRKNTGVVQNVKKIQGAIGYVEYTYATEMKMSCVLLQNRSGKFIKPDMSSFQAACSNAKWMEAPGFYMVLTDQPGEDTWPITGVTYILIYKNQQDMAKAAEMLNYFNWCYTKGASSAEKMKYVPVPEKVVDMVRKRWKDEVLCGGKHVWKD